MINKKDPLISAVQKVMQTNQAERNAVTAVNEKFGVVDRRALPRERQHEWDSAYKSILTEGLHPNQQKLDVHEPEKDELTKKDFDKLRAMGEEKKMKDSKHVVAEDETSPSSMGIKKPDYAPAGSTPDYAQPTTQTVNRAEKTSLPAGTIKEAVMNKIMKKLEERKLTAPEMKKREEVAKAMKKDNPSMPMSKKMAIATSVAKKAAE